MAHCPRCGASYDEGIGLASCPACLLRLGMEESDTADELLGEPVAAHPAAPGEPIPERIGDYTILELLGTGGMGAVYRAEQHEPIHRRVAVKVIKAGLCTPEVVARFEAEREALALMSHPSIATVLDAGTTDDGRPFVVMEYVPGIRITDYCDRHRLDLRHRLELFREVCSGVLHAHQKGIVHRDLKPSNVLVTEVDGQPRVKVIDFGLAKALHGRLTDGSLFTHFGVLLGTPAYMSPEQVQPSRLDIDTRTDVYSLGVLLYELLTGVLPFNYAEVKEFAIAELQHLLLELEPERPSQRLHALGDQAEELAQRRGADVSTLRRLLRDDLDWIVMHALERDRSRRYQSAGELAADIDRHLSDEPVSAGPPAPATGSASWRSATGPRPRESARPPWPCSPGRSSAARSTCAPSRRARKPTATAESPSGAATSPSSAPLTRACESVGCRGQTAPRSVPGERAWLGVAAPGDANRCQLHPLAHRGWADRSRRRGGQR